MNWFCGERSSPPVKIKVGGKLFEVSAPLFDELHRDKEEKKVAALPKKKAPSTTVKFNVGGKLYEVSKSLLKGFPDTVLAKKAKSESSSPIFVDRDPDRFAFCLDYMRGNGKVQLAETVSKAAFIEELKFFGFVDIDETKIVCNEKIEQNWMAGFQQTVQATKQRIARLEKELAMEKVALRCLERSLDSQKNGEFSVNYRDLTMSNVHNDQFFIDCCDKLGLLVDIKKSQHNKVHLTPKTNPKGQK